MYASVNRVSICSNNGLSPIRRQAIILTNAGRLSIGLLATNVSEILIKIQNFSFTKMHLKISFAKWWPFCPGGRWVNGDLYMIVAADWTDGVCGCIYCNWNSIVKLYVKKRSGSILVQVITCWLMTPNHYLDQCWLIMTEVMWYLY